MADLASRRDRGLLAGATTTATWVVATGVVLLLGPASPIILVALLLTGLPAIWVCRRFAAAGPDAPTDMPATWAGSDPGRYLNPRPVIPMREYRHQLRNNVFM